MSSKSSVTALRYYGQRDVKLEKVPSSPCGPHDVRLEIAFCGICGSDIHEYLGGPIFPPQPGSMHQWTGESLPVTMGHEMSGVVVERGCSVVDLKIGSRVAVNPALDDRHYGIEPCNTCKLGKINICKRYSSYRLSAPGGGFATEIVVNSLNCIALPDSVSLKVGALLEPLAVGWHCIRTSGFKKNQTALILGAGPIGLAILMLLQVWEARTVIVSEVTTPRKQMAAKFGADLVIDPSTTNIIKATADAVDLDGVDIAFETTGLQTTLDTAVAAVRPGGTIFNVAIHEKPLSLNLNDLACYEKILTGGMCYTMDDFQGVLRALDNDRLPVEDMITSIVPLGQVVEKGFVELINNKIAHVKILVQPSEFRTSKPRLESSRL